MTRGRPFKKGHTPWNFHGKMEIICQTCSKKFHVEYNRRATAKYCSVKCHGIADSAKIDSSRLIGLIKAGAKQKTIAADLGISPTVISRKLKHLGYKKEPNPINYRKRAIRYFRSRKINFCQVCFFDEVPEILVIHHIDGDRKNDSDDNFALLCPNCHACAHLTPNGVNHSAPPTDVKPYLDTEKKFTSDDLSHLV